MVVAKGSAVHDSKLRALRRIFINEGDSDRSGQRYVPFNQPPHITDRVAFDEIVIGMSADEVREVWIERKIHGMPGPPRSVDSLSVLQRLIARLAGYYRLRPAVTKRARRAQSASTASSRTTSRTRRLSE